MSKTNTLMSHCGESRSFPCNKMVPQHVIHPRRDRQRTITSIVARQTIKHRHNKRVRVYYKTLIREELV